MLRKLYIPLLFFIFGCSTDQVDVVDHFKNIYGLSTDTLNVEEFSIRNGQNLSDMLVEQGIDYPVIDQIVSSSSSIYDVRKMRAGNTYYVLSTKDSLEEPKYLVYERNPIDFVVFGLTDSFEVYLQSKSLITDTIQTSGIIDGSLWITMMENADDPNLAIALSEIYAWSIDFFGLYPNDSYKIIYEKTYADTQYIGIGNILAAEFGHRGSPYYAFYFLQDQKSDYFDEKGESLRRAFLKAPLRYSRISSGFSYNRRHPILKIRRPHLGVDYVAPLGTPVHTVGDGVITKAGRFGQAGRMVEVKHNGTYRTQYLHLSKYGAGIKVGSSVKQGQVIGYVGSSGLSTGAHLDFRFYQNGKAVDPLRIESPSVEPIDPENVEEFNNTKNYWKQQLDSISSTGAEANSVTDSI